MRMVCCQLCSFVPLSPVDEKSSELMTVPEWKLHCAEQVNVELSQKCQGTGAAGPD